jgi:hypothetical protein
MHVAPPESGSPQRLPPSQRFGGKVPFQHHSSDVNQYFGEDCKDEYGQDNMFFVQRRNRIDNSPNKISAQKYNGSPTKARKDEYDPWAPKQAAFPAPGAQNNQEKDPNVLFKDPDVWDPPTPKQEGPRKASGWGNKRQPYQQHQNPRQAPAQPRRPRMQSQEPSAQDRNHAKYERPWA